MNQRTLREGVVKGAMCNVCGLVCQRLTEPAVYDVQARNSYGGLQAHRKVVHAAQPLRRDRPA